MNHLLLIILSISVVAFQSRAESDQSNVTSLGDMRDLLKSMHAIPWATLFKNGAKRSDSVEFIKQILETTPGSNRAEELGVDAAMRKRALAELGALAVNKDGKLDPTIRAMAKSTLNDLVALDDSNEIYYLHFLENAGSADSVLELSQYLANEDPALAVHAASAINDVFRNPDSKMLPELDAPNESPLPFGPYSPGFANEWSATRTEILGRLDSAAKLRKGDKEFAQLGETVVSAKDRITAWNEGIGSGATGGVKGSDIARVNNPARADAGTKVSELELSSAGSEERRIPLSIKIAIGMLIAGAIFIGIKKRRTNK